MCGITGVYAYNMVGRMHFMQLENATRTISSRGPDFHNSYHDNRVALGHRRLSIIDTSEQGHQPMHDRSGRYIIVYNGEIFNFRRLKDDLQAKDYSFQSETDTEVLLNLYMEYGKQCLSMLNGFFAFAIYDKEEESLFIARDRYGIKPLYVYQDENSVIFASEMKALFSYGINKQLDYEALWQYLQMNYISAPKSVLKNVKKLLPGHYLKLTPQNTEENAFYHLNDGNERRLHGSYRELQQEFEKLMESAVQDRLVSDVPVGTFLSGGIDSSVITMLAARHKPDLHSFSIGFKDASYFDETKYARAVARKAGIQHTVFEIGNKDLLDSIEDILNYTDEPFADSSAIAVNILCRETRKHATVALSGDGADELFGGYNKHEAWMRILHSDNAVKAARAGKLLWKILPKSRSTSVTNKFRQLDRLAKAASLSPAERYWFLASFAGEQETLKMFSENSRDKLDQENYTSFKSRLNGSVQDNLSSHLLADLKMTLPDDMLTKVDRMSMKNSLEVRVPFLDYRIVEFAFAIDDQYKIDGGIRKKIVQDTFRNILPEELYNRPKKGFEVPLLQWLRKDLKPYIDELLSEDLIQQQGVFDHRYIKQLKMKLRSSNPGDSHARIWGLVVFHHWYKKYM